MHSKIAIYNNLTPKITAIVHVKSAICTIFCTFILIPIALNPKRDKPFVFYSRRRD